MREAYKNYDPQPAITCSKLTTETLEQDVKYVQSKQWKHKNKMSNMFKVNNKYTRTMPLPLASFWYVYC